MGDDIGAGKPIECIRAGDVLSPGKIVAENLDQARRVSMTVDAQQCVYVGLAARSYRLSYFLGPAQEVIGKGMLQAIEPHQAALWLKRLGGNGPRAVQFKFQFGEWRDVVVALDHGRGRSKSPNGLGVKRPYWVNNRMIVGVDDARAVMLMARKMDLANPLGRNAVEIAQWLEFVVEGADIDIVHIQQQVAVGAPRHFRQEFTLGHRGMRERDVAGDVLDEDAPPVAAPVPAYPAYDMLQRLLAQGRGSRSCMLMPPISGPAQMIRNPGWLYFVRKRLQAVQIPQIERVGRADRQRYAVQDHRPALAYPHQRMQRPPAGDHVIFGNRLEPIDPRIALENLGK